MGSLQFHLRPLRRVVSLVTESSAVGIKNLGLSLLTAEQGGRFLCYAQGGSGVAVMIPSFL